MVCHLAQIPSCLRSQPVKILRTWLAPKSGRQPPTHMEGPQTLAAENRSQPPKQRAPCADCSLTRQATPALTWCPHSRSVFSLLRPHFETLHFLSQLTFHSGVIDHIAIRRKRRTLMKKLLTLALATLAITSTVAAFGADNSLGTWKLNVEKSKYTPAPFPVKSITAVREAADNGVKVTNTGERADGSKSTPPTPPNTMALPLQSPARDRPTTPSPSSRSTPTHSAMRQRTAPTNITLVARSRSQPMARP